MKTKIFLILLIIGLLGAGVFLLRNSVQINLKVNEPKTTAKVLSPSITTKPTVKIEVAPTELVFPTNTNPNVIRYTSKNLGVSFTYLKKQQDQNVIVLETGKKIEVKSDSMTSSGQYLEIFTKGENETLIEAIKKHFLTGFSEKDCLVKSGKDDKYPQSYVTATIQVPQTENEGMDTLSEKWSKCPDSYTTTNGISYFLENTNVPTKFLYLSIGQYGIESEDNKLWQETLTIF